MNCNTNLNSQVSFFPKFITFELKQTQMNLKPFIAWTFVGSVVLLFIVTIYRLFNTKYSYMAGS